MTFLVMSRPSKEVLDQLKAGDKIESAKVIDGLENLIEPVA